MDKLEFIRNKQLKKLVEINEKEKDFYIPLGINNRSLKKDTIQSLPHLLVGGTVMSGKSTFLHTFINTLIISKNPSDYKLVLMDSKRIEFLQYNGIPHLLCPVIHDFKRANLVLQKIAAEIDNRYNLMTECRVKSISDYNNYIERVRKYDSNGILLKMPYFIIVIDELQDFTLINSIEIENLIKYIIQNGHRAGIHLIISSNYPSSKFISSITKSNIVARLSFKVASSRDSIVILDEPGANKLVGYGNALYKSRDNSKLISINSLKFTDDEIAEIINYVCKEQVAQYNEEFANISTESKPKDASGMADGADDPLYDEIVEFAIQTGKVSASLLQRRFRLGYNRAERLIDLLEERGIIGSQIGSKPREVLVKLDNGNTIYINDNNINKDDNNIDKKKQKVINNYHNVNRPRKLRNHSTVLDLIVVFFLIIIFFAFACAVFNDYDKKNNHYIIENEKKITKGTYDISQDIYCRKQIITVNSFKKASKIDELTAKGDKQFFEVNVSIKNNNNEKLDIQVDNFKLNNSSGKEYSILSIENEHALKNVDLKAKASVNGIIWFEIDKSDKDLTLSYNCSEFLFDTIIKVILKK